MNPILRAKLAKSVPREYRSAQPVKLVVAIVLWIVALAVWL